MGNGCDECGTISVFDHMNWIQGCWKCGHGATDLSVGGEVDPNATIRLWTLAEWVEKWPNARVARDILSTRV